MEADNRSPSSEAQEALDLGAAPAGDDANSATSAGALLRAYREEADMEQETLAAALKVSPQKLQALESDDYSALPALYFARGLAANICRHLERDPAPVLALMPGEKPHIPVAGKNDASMRMQPTAPVSIGSGSGGLLKWLVAVIVLLALLAGAVWFIPQLRARIMAAPASASSAAIDAVMPATTLALEPASAAPAPLTLQPATLQSAAADTAASAAAEANNTLLIQASGNTWVKVSTPKGKKVFEGNLKAGDEQTITIAQYPVRVVIGKAENVQVLDRGQPFDLSGVVTRGTARFELKP
ncbi:MAG: helix-turn-helix domain-containing protein [Brachymonas sp.]|nr:helix-turn-helix domain-containing protein [Brachymonas sp.]